VDRGQRGDVAGVVAEGVARRRIAIWREICAPNSLFVLNPIFRRKDVYIFSIAVTPLMNFSAIRAKRGGERLNVKLFRVALISGADVRADTRSCHPVSRRNADKL
jgi:hypothetical protein